MPKLLSCGNVLHKMHADTSTKNVKEACFSIIYSQFYGASYFLKQNEARLLHV